MKKEIFYSMLLMMGLSLMSLTSSSSDDDSLNPGDNSGVISEVTVTVETGTWIITSFIDSGNNETNNCSGFNCPFSTDGELVADNDRTSTSGKCSIPDDDHSNDDSNRISDIDFNSAFSSSAHFSELTEDWEIVSRTSTKIDLRHVCGYNVGTETLAFEMN